MKGRARLYLLALLVLCVASRVSAQDAPASPDKPSDPPAPQNNNNPVQNNSNKAPFAISVGTGELINLNGQNTTAANAGQQDSGTEYADGLPVRLKGRRAGGELFYGVSASSVYTDDSPGLGTRSTVSTTVNPWVALLEPTRTGSYLLQYSAVVVPHDAITQDTRLFQTGIVAVQGALSRRLSWVISADGSYGSQSARLQGPLAYAVVQSTPMVNAGAEAVLLGDVNVLFVQTSAGLDWRKSARETVSVAVVHVLNGVDGNPAVPGSTTQYSNALGVKARYDRAVSGRYTLIAYGEADALLRIPLCTTLGGGAGLAIRVNQAVSLSFAGGPEFSSQACGGGQSASFNASVAVNLTRHDRIYAGASRQFSTAYQTTGVWEDTAAAGFAKDIGRLRFTTDAGWIRSEERPPVPTYTGYFVAPRISFRLTESLGVSASYRKFHGSGGLLVVPGEASFAAVSLDWHPAGKRLN